MRRTDSAAPSPSDRRGRVRPGLAGAGPALAVRAAQALGRAVRDRAGAADLARRDGRARLGELRRRPGDRRRLRRPPQLRHGAGGAAARGAGVPRRHPRRSPTGGAPSRSGARPPGGHVGRHRRQHGLDGQPLHRRQAAAARRRLHAGRRGRPAPRSRGGRLRAALPRGLPRRPDRARRHRGQPAPDRPLRLLVRQGPAVGAARRQGRPARLRQRRARHRRDRAPPGAGEPVEAIRDLRGTAFSRPTGPPPEGWTEIDSREVDTPGAGRRALRSLRRHDRPRGASANRRCAARRGAGAGPGIRGEPPPAQVAIARGPSFVCPTPTPWPPIRSSTRTPRACCTSSRTPGTPARWSSGTAIATSGSTRRRCRCRPPSSIASTSCRIRAARTPRTATPRSPPTT